MVKVEYITLNAGKGTKWTSEQLLGAMISDLFGSSEDDLYTYFFSKDVTDGNTTISFYTDWMAINRP